jgi:hypothetical protein
MSFILGALELIFFLMLGVAIIWWVCSIAVRY